MTEEDLLLFARESIFLLLEVSLPILIVSLIVGLLIALFQALTQIQEVTLTFVPKIVAVFLALLLLLPFMMRSMFDFMQSIADRIIALG